MVDEQLYERLEGQVALITGASSGLGRRFAKTLARQGIKVAIVARRREKLESLAAEIHDEGGVALPLTLDVARSETFGATLDAIEAKVGTVSILVNNAGAADTAPAIEIQIEAIRHLLAVNVEAPLVLSREVAKRLIASGRPGRIVNIASVAAHQVSASASIYSVTKAAVVKLTETLSLEWARYHINVNAISPGFFKTEMTDRYFGGKYSELINIMPRHRIGMPEDLDSTLIYLVSPGSRLITGTCVRVDDGQLAR